MLSVFSHRAVALLALVCICVVVPISAQTLRQVAELTTKNGRSGDSMGQSVAVDGNIVLVGVPYRTVGNNIEQGTVDIYSKPASGWHDMTQTRTLMLSGGVAYQTFGASLAISGNTFVVGAPNASDGCSSNSGAAYVFVRSDNRVRRVATLTPSDNYPCNPFGWSVAISGDTIVVGSPVNSPGGDGEAFVFVKPTSGWQNMTETAKLTASDSNQGPGWFGETVSVDGDTVVVGAYLQANTGEAYVFVKPSSGWTNMTETAKLTPSDGLPSDQFGFAVSISGNTVLVGSPYNPSGQQYGAGYIYVEPPTGWVNATETAKLTASNEAVFDLLGNTVLLAGNDALLGAPGVNYPANNDPGAAYAYVKPATGWKSTSTFQEKFTSSDGFPTDNFGSAIALSRSTLVIGAPQVHWDANFDSPGPGAAYVFGR
jgi:hypothetical protein